MPVLQIFSDIHTECLNDSGRKLIESLNPNKESRIAVVAGDIKTADRRGDVYKHLGDNFEHVVCVLGNHDYWKGSTGDDVPELPVNVHVLENRTITLEGIKFHGATGWFPQDDLNPYYEQDMPDFSRIQDFNPWVYKRNEETRQYLEANVREDDVVITHHIPFEHLVAPRWRGDQLNRFFVAGFDRVAELCLPKLWVYGHTHDSADLLCGSSRFEEGTRYVCNPYGYAGHELNRNFNKELLVTL